MKKIVLVRHGEVFGNKRSAYMGWTDENLTPAGLEQAGKLKQELKQFNIDRIFSSPLKRARQTSEIINEAQKIDIEYAGELKERNFGAWENLTFEEISEKYPAECGAWLEDLDNYRIPNGESHVEAYVRAVEFVEKHVISGHEDVYMIVTHLGCIRSIMAYLLGLDIKGIWRFRVDTGSYSVVELNDEGYAYLTCLNRK